MSRCSVYNAASMKFLRQTDRFRIEGKNLKYGLKNDRRAHVTCNVFTSLVNMGSWEKSTIDYSQTIDRAAPHAQCTLRCSVLECFSCSVAARRQRSSYVQC